ncbi:MAG: threonine dehydratase [Verrucomicrobia bacterium]|nr:threonine dehydratase [Verrucomicrobiota bacterium]MBV8275994.1 threonine dehydratase [Verrucomicrobiota bacterium]
MISPTLKQLRTTADFVHRVLPPTPQIRWPLLCRRTAAEVWVKHENHQPVGAFKIRGGLVYMNELKQREPDVPGVIAATRGNHGQSIAFAAGRTGLRAVIVVPHGNSVEKNAAMQALGAELVVQGSDFQDALEYAQELAEKEKLHFVPSFAEPLVRGVASYALELFDSVSGLDAVYVPIGMGSGACGVVAARNALGLSTEVIGVCATGAPAFALSFEAKRQITTDVVNTMADGVSCRVPDQLALEVILSGIARIVTVTDEEICAAIRYFFADTHNVAEGAAAAPLAALLQERTRMRGRRVALILSGGNIDSDLFAATLAPTK